MSLMSLVTNEYIGQKNSTMHAKARSTQVPVTRRAQNLDFATTLTPKPEL